MFDTERIENGFPVLVQLKQCAKRSIRGWIRRKRHDIVLGNPCELFNGNFLAGGCRARGQ